MAKLSEYVEAVARQGLSIVIHRGVYSFINQTPVAYIEFEDKHGHASGLKPYDFGLPGIVAGFEKEGN